MSETTNNYLRFDGRLTEDLQFKKYLGWETVRIAHRAPEGDGEYLLTLLDSTGRVLSTVAPNVNFGAGCSTAGSPRSARTECYLPLHEQGRSLVFSRGDVEIWREDVAKNPPKVGEVVWNKGEGSTYRISWTAHATSQKPLRFKLFFFVDHRLGVTLADELEGTERIVDLSQLPGGTHCQFGVLATDGVRSAVGVSKPFERPIRPTVVHISAPQHGQDMPFGQPTEARGSAFDQFGIGVPADSLEWMLDGKHLEKGAYAILLPALEPGLHHLRLSQVGLDLQTSVAEIEFKVGQPNSEQQKWAQMHLRAKRQSDSHSNKTT